MIVKAQKLAAMALAISNETNNSETARVAVGEYVNSQGQRCQLQLVATSFEGEHLDIAPGGNCFNQNSAN